jgi:hypothetical protein
VLKLGKSCGKGDLGESWRFLVDEALGASATLLVRSAPRIDVRQELAQQERVSKRESARVVCGHLHGLKLSAA